MERDKHAFYSNLRVEDRLRLYGMQLVDSKSNYSSNAKASNRSGSRSRREYRDRMKEFFQRMQEHARKSQQERERIIKQVKQETPFEPCLYTKHDFSDKESTYTNHKEFLERQSKFVQDRAEKQSRLVEDLDARFSFNPVLNKKSKEMMDKSPTRNIELIKAQVAVDKKTRQLMKDHNFLPTREPKRLPSKETYDRLYKEHTRRQESNEKKRDQIRQQLERKSMEACTFKPQLLTAPETIEGDVVTRNQKWLDFKDKSKLR